MGNYTSQLRSICESLSGYNMEVEYPEVADVIEKARTKIFSFDYPIFDVNYKKTLETNILRHFYTREIGFETYGLWKLKLETKMNEIMPVCNAFYKSEKMITDPFQDVNYTKSGNSESKGNRTDSGTSTDQVKNTTRDWYADTPQGALTGLENGTYMSNARKISDDNTQSKNKSGTMKADSSEDYLETIKGKMSQTSESKLLEEYRKTLINTDMKVIGELEELFFMLWTFY